MLKWIVPILLGIILVFVIGWLTGNKDYGIAVTKDDERSRLIKMKSIVGSWVFILMIFLIKFVFELLNLSQATIKLKYPELLYLILLFGSYFVHYWIYSRRMSGNEK